MENFLFYNPTKIIFGKGTIKNIAREIKRYGKKPLFVYGTGSIKKTGLYDKIVKILKENDIDFMEHAGVKSNPVLSHTHEGIRKAEENNCNIILAVGGGSVIDEGKAIAAGVLHEGLVWDFFNGSANIKKALPIITVLTIAATGSEMNAGCVITKEETKQKFSAHSPHLFPKVSILDPENTMSVSKEYTAYGVIDALSHVLEGYFSAQNDSAFITDEICEGICRTLIKSMNILQKEPSNYDARANIMWSATLALNGLQSLGYKNTEFINHAIEHSLSAIYNIPHGAGLSIVIPAYLKFNLQKGNFKAMPSVVSTSYAHQTTKAMPGSHLWRDKAMPGAVTGNRAHQTAKRIVRFGKKVLNISGKDDKAIAKETIEAIKKWFSKIGAPITLAEVNIPEKDIPKITENAMELIKLWGMSYAKKSVQEILSLSK